MTEEEVKITPASSREIDDITSMLDTPDRGLFDAFAKAAKDAMQAVRDGGDLGKLVEVAKTLCKDSDVRITYRVAKLVAVKLGVQAVLSMSPQALVVAAIQLMPEINKIVAEEKALSQD